MAPTQALPRRHGWSTRKQLPERQPCATGIAPDLKLCSYYRVMVVEPLCAQPLCTAVLRTTETSASPDGTNRNLVRPHRAEASQRKSERKRPAIDAADELPLRDGFVSATRRFLLFKGERQPLEGKAASLHFTAQDGSGLDVPHRRLLAHLGGGSRSRRCPFGCAYELAFGARQCASLWHRCSLPNARFFRLYVAFLRLLLKLKGFV